MKWNAKIRKTIIITFKLLFTFLTLTTINLNFNVVNMDNNTVYVLDISEHNENLLNSNVSGKIHIDNNWTDAKNAGICTGSGTYSDPYIIKDKVIDAGGSGSCIWIENSNVFFKIENCTLYNSGQDWTDAGIKLSNVFNGLVTNNNAFYNENGIYLSEIMNNTISENNVNNNFIGIKLSRSGNNTILANIVNLNTFWGISLSYSGINIISGNQLNSNGNNGINLWDSDYNIITRNIINNNYYGINLESCSHNTISENIINNNFEGIFLDHSSRNTISGNIVNNNFLCGISLIISNYNTILGNKFIGNNVCICENDCEGNIIEFNYCFKVPIIQGYNSVFLLSTLFIIAIILIKNKKKTSKLN